MTKEPRKDIKKKSYLTPGEVAELLMISPIRVRQLALKGELKSVTTPGGHRRFAYQEIERFVRERKLQLPWMADDKLRVLIVDDDRQFTGYLSALFARFERWVVTEVSNDGFDAGMKVMAFAPNVVLLDLMMPGLDGFEVCRIIKQNPLSCDIRVIAMTGHASAEHKHRIVEAGAEVCLAKPIDTELLLQTLELADAVTDDMP